jgi:hypothetical protein
MSPTSEQEMTACNDTHAVLDKRLRVLAVSQLRSELGERGETLRVGSVVSVDAPTQERSHVGPP